MRVVCENCGATYKIPESKLAKEVNKATCRKCGFRMMIRRPTAASSAAEGEDVEPDEAATQVTANPLQEQEEERELLEAETRIEKGAIDDWSDELPTNVQADPAVPPAAGSASSAPAVPRPTPSPRPAGSTQPGTGARADTDMILALFATFASAGGAMLLATNTGFEPIQRMVGLGIALWGALTCLFLLVTGNLWRQKGSLSISIALATVLSVGAAAFVEVALHEGEGLELAMGSTANKTDGSQGQTAADAETLDDDAPPSTGSDPEQAANEDDAAAEDAAAAADAAEDDAGDSPGAETAAGDDVPEPQARAPSERTAPPATETSSARSIPPASAPTDELDLEDPPEDLEELDEPDFGAVAASNPTESAEERRRQEMEQAAQARAATREREAREAARAKESKRLAAERARNQPKQAKAPESKAGGAAKMATLPLTVVDTMIKSNLSVKRCFFNEKQASGEMPRRVNVRFTVLNSGRVSSARITTDRYKGGSLDSCLGRAFKAIQFPPFQGEAKSMTYPFVL